MQKYFRQAQNCECVLVYNSRCAHISERILSVVAGWPLALS